MCPQRPGALVRLYGTYGVVGHKRQRYQCVSIGGAAHTFTEVLPRKRTAPGDCFECERPYEQHEGPQAPRTYAFGVREIARALIRVGQGASYREAGRNVRRQANRRRSNPPPYGAWSDVSAEPNVVEDWVEVFAPVVFAPFAPTCWPAKVVADHVPFHIPAVVTRRSGTLAFCVFGAVGYDPGQRRQIVRLEAFGSPSRANWKRFFAALPGTPQRVVTDNAPGLVGAVTAVWPRPGDPAPTHALCEYHLATQIAAILKRHHLDQPDARIKQAADKAFWNDLRWAAFVAEAEKLRLPELDRWLARNGARAAAQVAANEEPRSTGAVETPLTRVRAWLEDRRRQFRNRDRMNRLLMLIQLHLNGQDDERTYMRLIRAHLLCHSGRSEARRLILDHAGTSSLRAR